MGSADDPVTILTRKGLQFWPKFVRQWDVVAEPFATCLGVRLTFAHRYRKKPQVAVGTREGRLWHEGEQVLEDRLEMVGGDPTPLRRVIP